MKILTTLCLTLLVSIALVAQTPPANDAQAKALAPLQGNWAITEINGQPLADSGTEMWLTVTGDKYSQTVNGTVNERGTLKVDPSKKPMAIDLIITEGDDAGKTQLGVIQVSGDTITGNLNTPGANQRPADFAAMDGYLLFIAKKQR